MVKANGYGTGAAWAARTLADQKGLYGFGVASMEEGAEVRAALGRSPVPVFVFSDTAPWTEEVGRYCLKHGLSPVLVSREDVERFIAQGWAKRLRYEIKFNTGMNRLGVDFEDIPRVATLISRLPHGSHPTGILSHMAIGDRPSHALSREQRSRMGWIMEVFASASPMAKFHFANSSGLWNLKRWKLDTHTHAVRVGISLYGIPPWSGAPDHGVSLVGRISARVLQVRTVHRGQSVGYSAYYKPAHSVRVATLSAGYADGIVRALGCMHSNPKLKHPKGPGYLGRVSMDLTAVPVGPRVKPGDSILLMGPEHSMWDLAHHAGTAPYELLTSLSRRVQRIYV